MLEIINQIFKFVFEDETLEVSEETSMEELQSWDSLKQLQLVCCLEEAYQVRFSMQEIIRIRSVKEMVQLLKKRGYVD